MSSTKTLRAPQRELWRHLWGWTLGALLCVWLSLIAVAWSTGHHEAEEITDGQLMAIARLWLATQPVPTQPLGEPLDRRGVRSYVQDVAVLQWRAGHLVADTHQWVRHLHLDAGLPQTGWSVQRVGRSDWRMYVAESGQNRVAVLMDMGQRYDLGKDVAARVARPALLVLPLIALGLWWTIRRGLRPLESLSSEVAELGALAGQRLDTQHRFREFSSTVLAINTLLDTLQAQAQRERDFASDVAHELRTPLAAITLQANAAQHDPTPERLARLEQESLRAGRILSQLLELSRAQRWGVGGAASGLEQARPLDLGAVAAELISSHAQLAHESGHELSLKQPEQAVQVSALPMLLELAVRNLLENALRHTPPGTQVGVEVWRAGGALGLSVSDDGQRDSAAGLSPPSSDVGLGLGLRLVQRMAEQMGAVLERGAGAPPMTTRFTLRWPGSGERA